MCKVTASVVLYNTPETQLARLFSCIERAGIIQNVYLIDNSPAPSKCDLYHLSWVTYIRSESNVGYGAGHNIALKKAILSSQYHFVLNPDIYFEPEELHKMIVRMKEDDSIGQLMPRVIYPDGSLQYLCKLIPTPVDLLLRRFLRGPLKELARQKFERYELRFTGYNHEMDVPTLSGCFMLFRTSALEKIGLFDERFFMYTEDFDISRRMHSQYRTIFFPGATIVHEHAKESYKSNKMLIVHIKSAILYFNKWGWFFDAGRKEVNARALKSLEG